MGYQEEAALTQLQQGQGNQSMLLPTNRLDSYAAAYIQKQMPSLIKWELDLKDVVLELKQDITGEEYQIRDDTPELVQVSAPLMNREGTQRVIGFNKFDFSKGVILSNFSESQIQQLTEEQESIMNFMIHIKHREFNIDPAFLMPLRAQFGRAVLASYNKALEGQTAKLLRETQSHSEVVSNQGGQNKGWLGSIFRGSVR